MMNSSMICERCKVSYVIGKAIDPNPSGWRCWGFGQRYEPITYENLKLIDVFKCPGCGLSHGEE